MVPKGTGAFRPGLASQCHSQGILHDRRLSVSLSDRTEVALRCHEIQIGLGLREVPEFEYLTEVGMAVRLALHLRGLPIVAFDLLKLVAQHFLSIPPIALRRIVELLADVEFVRIYRENKTIKSVLPTVPYYQDLFETMGEYADSECNFNETEKLTIEIVRRLARAPENRDALLNSVAADRDLFGRAVGLGITGSYIVSHRVRGRNMLVNPHYFSENLDLYTDAAAAMGSKTIHRLLSAIRNTQGVPLSLVEQRGEIAGVHIQGQELQFLKDLAKFGVVKPPMIRTSHHGENHFLFTPTPYRNVLSPLQKEVYEKAMAIVAAVRQGQYLAERYSIRNPAAIIYTLKDRKKLGRATTEAAEQYRNLVHLRIGRIVNAGGEFATFHIIETEENMEALEIAYSLVTEGETSSDMVVDRDARSALQQKQEYVESLVASGSLRQRDPIKLTQAQQLELDFLLYGGEM